MQNTKFLKSGKKWTQTWQQGLYDEITKNTDCFNYSVKRLCLSSEIYGYDELNRQIKNLQQDESFNHKNFNFKERYYIKESGNPAMVIMCNPKNFNVKSVLWMNKPLTGLADLIKFNRNYPYFKVDLCEYSADLFSTNPHELYDMLCETLYFPYLNNNCTRIKDGSNNRKTNRFSNSIFLKIYECGNDDDKVTCNDRTSNWFFEKCDRVRLEFTVDRSELQRIGIVSLSDLIHNPNFFKLLRERFQTSRSKQQNAYPKWQRITTIIRKMQENKRVARSIIQYLNEEVNDSK